MKILQNISPLTQPINKHNMTEGNEPVTPTHEDFGHGLTKREYFAAMAMQGMLSNIFDLGESGTISQDFIASHAVVQADALINALNK
jgi:hypothetical protein